MLSVETDRTLKQNVHCLIKWSQSTHATGCYGCALVAAWHPTRSRSLCLWMIVFVRAHYILISQFYFLRVTSCSACCCAIMLLVAAMKKSSTTSHSELKYSQSTKSPASEAWTHSDSGKRGLLAFLSAKRYVKY